MTATEEATFWKYLRGSTYKNGFGSASTAMEVASKNKEQIEGKVAVVTGCNTGIGKETVKALAANGCKVVMACRNLEKCKSAAEDIKNEVPTADLVTQECDLSSFESTRKFASDFEELKLPLHMLINNAGVMACPKMETKDGLEMQLGTNHFGHFLLTELLTPKLIESAPSRIVNVSSEGHRFSYKGGIRLDDINSDEDYSRTRAYGQSKLANILHARELNKRFIEQKVDVLANALHPGGIKTDLARHIPGNKFMFPLISPIMKVFGKSIPQGAATTLFCASDPWITQDNSGEYFADCNLGMPTLPQNVDEHQLKFWELSEKITGLKRDGDNKDGEEKSNL